MTGKAVGNDGQRGSSLGGQINGNDVTKQCLHLAVRNTQLQGNRSYVQMSNKTSADRFYSQATYLNLNTCQESHTLMTGWDRVQMAMYIGWYASHAYS